MENKNSKVDKIIKELEQNLSKMTNEEREIFFKEMGFVFIEETPKKRKQQLINLLATLQAVLELRKQSDSNATTTKPTYEEIMKMMEKMDFDDAPVIIEGSHPAKNIPDDEELHASLKYLKRISVAQSQPNPRKYK